jgi:hypothetical protein
MTKPTKRTNPNPEIVQDLDAMMREKIVRAMRDSHDLYRAADIDTRVYFFSATATLMSLLTDIMARSALNETEISNLMLECVREVRKILAEDDPKFARWHEKVTRARSKRS